MWLPSRHKLLTEPVTILKSVPGEGQVRHQEEFLPGKGGQGLPREVTQCSGLVTRWGPGTAWNSMDWEMFSNLNASVSLVNYSKCYFFVSCFTGKEQD